MIVVSPFELERLVRAAVRDALEAAALTSTSAAPPGGTREWLDAGAAAEMLGVNRRTILKLARSSKLRGERIGKLWRFRRANVEGLHETRERTERTR